MLLQHLARGSHAAAWSLQHSRVSLSQASNTCWALSAACQVLVSQASLLASAQTTTRRSYASSTSFDSSGPSAGLLSAVPFTVSRQEADAAFDAYHSAAHNILMSKPAAGLQKVKEIYLPLWVARAQGDYFAHLSSDLIRSSALISANGHTRIKVADAYCVLLLARSTLRGAEIGFNKMVRRYNPLSKRTESTYETQYHWVSPGTVFDQYFSPEMAEMQIVASYHYPHADILKLRPGPDIASAKQVDRHMMTSPSDGSTRRVSAFEMKAETGRVKAISAIKAHQYNAARDFLLRAYKCDDTRGINLDVNLMQFSAAPVLMPVFLYSSRHFGNTKVRTFVAGFGTANASGVRVFDENKIGFAAGALASAGVLLSGIWKIYPAFQLFSFAVAAPALLIGFAAKYWPQLRNNMHKVRRDAEQYMNRTTDQSGSFSTSWTHTYSQFERFRQSREQSQHQSSGSSGYSGGSAGYSRGSSGAQYSSSDPKGYYKLLEIEPSASKADVQAAFRGLAMKQHPDRFEDSKQKAAATVKFRHILEAYTVLRDNNKRHMYDSNQL